MILETRAVAPFFKNGYLLGCEVTRDAVLIDPGDEVGELLDAVGRHQLKPSAILLTHGHLDHVTGVARAKAALNVPVWLHRDDNFLYEGVVQQGLMFGLRVEPQPTIDHFYADGQKIRFGEYEISVHHTPGHCPGGVALAVNGDPRTSGPTDRRVLIVGDTLFAGSVGRTDLPGGDMETLLRSIRDVLFRFPDGTPVYSGHGPVTTIGEEKRTNPFLRGV
ncbi:MAG TPA: MBL fold metallo-hydrolase [Vicinamibacterales bacterium]|nr:MBL fold metallo-hydrolase [Vicinamibacterales bacterium]